MTVSTHTTIIPIKNVSLTPESFLIIPSSQFPSTPDKGVFWFREKRPSGPDWDYSLLTFATLCMSQSQRKSPLEVSGAGWRQLVVEACLEILPSGNTESQCWHLTASPGRCSPAAKIKTIPAHFLPRPVAPGSLSRSMYRFLVLRPKAFN